MDSLFALGHNKTVAFILFIYLFIYFIPLPYVFMHLRLYRLLILHFKD